MEVAPGLNHHRVPVHGLTERTKRTHQRINVLTIFILFYFYQATYTLSRKIVLNWDVGVFV